MSLAGSDYHCLERNIPLLCFGDGRDMELTLWSCDRNTTTPLATKVSCGQTAVQLVIKGMLCRT